MAAVAFTHGTPHKESKPEREQRIIGLRLQRVQCSTVPPTCTMPGSHTARLYPQQRMCLTLLNFEWLSLQFLFYLYFSFFLSISIDFEVFAAAESFGMEERSSNALRRSINKSSNTV